MGGWGGVGGGVGRGVVGVTLFWSGTQLRFTETPKLVFVVVTCSLLCLGTGKRSSKGLIKVHFESIGIKYA